jgi:sec-independent protein translocase protein TatA
MVEVFGFAPTPLTVFLLIVVVLVIFGPGKLPDVGKALGKGIREFKKASDSPSQEPGTDLVSSAPTQAKVAEESKADG